MNEFLPTTATVVEMALSGWKANMAVRQAPKVLLLMQDIEHGLRLKNLLSG